MKRSLPKDVAELVKANAESRRARDRSKDHIDAAVAWVQQYHGIDRATLAEVLDGAAQRLRDEHEQAKKRRRR